MLSAEQQWKVLQKEEKRTGRGKRRKKTLTEQIQEMGGFSHDPDSELAIKEELERRDTRGPLQHPRVSISECEETFGNSSFGTSRKRFFHSWIFQASRPSGWIQTKDLPSFFRFALHRPIMDERAFQALLQTLNLQLDPSKGNVRQPCTRPIGRSRQMMLGIATDNVNVSHPSNSLKHVLPKGAAKSMDRSREEAARIVPQDDEDMQEILRRQLWTVYEHVQNGSVPLETARWHYRDAFSKQDISDEGLVICLQQLGVPTDHISTDERYAHQESAHCQSSSDEKPSNLIRELGSYVALYRSGILQRHEVIPMIRDHLDDFKLDVNTISDILTDLEKDEQTAALLIWEDALQNTDEIPKIDASQNSDGSVSSENLFMQSSSSPSSSSSEEEEEEPQPDQKNSLRAVMLPEPHTNEEKDDEATVTLSILDSKPPDQPTTKDMDFEDGFEENEPKQLQAMSIDQSLISLPAKSLGKLSTCPHADNTKSSMLPPITPKPKFVSLASGTEELGREDGVDFGWESPRNRANVGCRRSSSPDEGMTTGICGLLLPTKEARDLAYKMKVRKEDIDFQVRKYSVRNTSKRRASLAKTVVTLPRSKRKASMALHKDTSSKSPKKCDHLDIFAREGEDHKTFVLSHFDSNEVIPLECTEPVCRECLQHQCMCDPLYRADEGTQTASPEGNPSSDALHAKLVDRSRLKPPKQSVTLLAYLARALDDDDVLASIKQLERLAPAATAISDVEKILYHMQQATRGGYDIDSTGTHDQEAIRILNVIVRSAPKLADYLGRLYRELTEGNDSNLSADDSHDELQEGPDLDSSLLNSSPDHKHILVPLPEPVASAAAFPRKQSNVANNAVSQANNTLLAKSASSYLPTSAPDVSVPSSKLNSGTENAAQPSCNQTATASASSAAGDSSRAKNCSGSPGGGKYSTAGGHPSQAECSPGPPAGGPLSSATQCSEQVSDHRSDAEGDLDDTIGAPPMTRFHSSSRDRGNSDVGMRLPPSSKPGTKESDKNVLPTYSIAKAKQLPESTPSSSPMPSLRKSPKSIPATPRLKSRELPTAAEATSELYSFAPGFDSLPVWPPQPGLSGRAGTEWKGITPMQALEHAKEKAFSERKFLACYLEERRAVRTRIKKENDHTNSIRFDHSFFQTSNGVPGSSSSTTAHALKKLFDKYRGTSSI